MSHAVSIPVAKGRYDEDLVLWAEEQAQLLRDGSVRDRDRDTSIDEVEGVGRSRRDAIESRLAVLLAHLVKWRYRPGGRSRRWRGTILEQRRGIASVIRKSPSLGGSPRNVAGACDLAGRLAAGKETGIDLTLSPETPPFTIEAILDDNDLPREPDLEGPKS